MSTGDRWFILTVVWLIIACLTPDHVICAVALFATVVGSVGALFTTK
jgi:hypothetical protein